MELDQALLPAVSKPLLVPPDTALAPLGHRGTEAAASTAAKAGTAARPTLEPAPLGAVVGRRCVSDAKAAAVDARPLAGGTVLTATDGGAIREDE